MRFHLTIALFLAFLSMTNAFAASVVELTWKIHDKLGVIIKDEDAKPLQRQDFEKCINTKDIRNGYLYIECNSVNFSYEAAVFNKSNGNKLVILVENGASVENRYVYEFSDHESQMEESKDCGYPKISESVLIEQYRKVFPNLNKPKELLLKSVFSSFTTKLPRKGTTIQIFAG